MAAVASLPLLSDDLGRECFFGYEHAGLQELRGMVQLFVDRAAQTSVQQRRAFSELSNTAQTVSMAQKRVEELMPLLDRSTAMEARVVSLESELSQVNASLIEAREAHASGAAEVQRLQAELATAEQRAGDMHHLAQQKEEELSRLRALAAMPVQSRLSREEDAQLAAGLSTDFSVLMQDSWLADNGRRSHGSDAMQASVGSLSLSLSSCAPSTSGRSGGLLQKMRQARAQAAVADGDDDLVVSGMGVPPSTNSQGACSSSSNSGPRARHLQQPLMVTQDPKACLATQKQQAPQASQRNSRDADDLDGLTLVDEEGILSQGTTAVGSGEPTRGLSGQAGSRAGGGVRFLLDRRQPLGELSESAEVAPGQPTGTPERKSRQQALSSSECDDPLPPPASYDTLHSAAKASPDKRHQSNIDEDFPLPGVPARSALPVSMSITDVSKALLDRLYEECIARAGGALRGPAGVLSVLLDLAGEDRSLVLGAEGTSDRAELADVIQSFGSLDNTEVSKGEFQTMVAKAFAWRRSQDLQRYETAGLAEVVHENAQEHVAASNTNAAGAAGAAAAAAAAAAAVQQWVALPSWSMDLARLSCDAEPSKLDRSMQDHIDGKTSAGEQWIVVVKALDALCSKVEALSGRGKSRGMAIAPLEEDAWASMLQTLRSSLSSFLQCFVEEARSRLRAAHATAGRLLEQRRRAMDELAAQLEAQDAELQQAMQECATLRARGESGLAGSTSNHTAACGHITTNGVSEEVMTHHQVSITLEPEPKMPREEKLQGTAIEQMGSSQLLRELHRTSQDAALQRAMEAEAALRTELQEVRDVLEQRAQEDAERQAQESSSKAAEAAAVEERISLMHGGCWFEKVSFRRQAQRHWRFVRLTFDLERIEWATQVRGPVKALPVQAIVRVDYGDASRAYRCYEFGHQNRPPPTLCLSICTPSRTLDLIAETEADVEAWVLGLNEVVPYRPERQRLTAQDFWVRRAMLHMEMRDTPAADLVRARKGPPGDEEDWDNASVSTRTNSTAHRSEGTAASARKVLMNMMPRQWGFRTQHPVLS